MGGITSAFVLRRLGIAVTLLPTTLFGRHPGWGDPGGTATPTAQLRAMWDAVQAQIETQNRRFDAVMTGYMGHRDHVDLAATIIDKIEPETVLVDPVMGDAALYIDAARAEAICDQLIPRAHIVTPNLWEWRYITGSLREHPLPDPTPLTGARETLITSVEPTPSAAKTPPQIGARLFVQDANYRHQRFDIHHDKFARVPHGGGDALAAAYLAHRLDAKPPEDALARSVSAVFQMMLAANAADAGELPLIRMQDALITAPSLSVQATHLEDDPHD